MTENEILARGVVAGMAIVLPFLGITIARWHSWKWWAKYWQEQNKFAHARKNQLFRDLKIEEDKRKYFESKLKSFIERYKPIRPINKPTDNNKNNAIELLKPRRMENGCEYYLAGEVRLCIEQAARQIAESNSVYKELDSIINHLKYIRCIRIIKKLKKDIKSLLNTDQRHIMECLELGDPDKRIEKLRKRLDIWERMAKHFKR